MKDLFPRDLNSVDGLTFQAAIENADLHAAKHEAKFGDRSDDSIECERRARESLEAAQAKLRGLDRIIRPDTPGYADAKLRAEANVETWTRRVAAYVAKYGTPALIASCLVLPAFFPSKVPAIDTNTPAAPHAGEKRAPGVTDDAWGGAGRGLCG